MIERAVVLARGNPITVEHLPFDGHRQSEVSPKGMAARRTKLDKETAELEDRRQALEEDEADVAGSTAENGNGAGTLKDHVADLERQLIKEALDRAGGNRTKAAEELGIYRRLLYAKIKEYGLEE